MTLGEFIKNYIDEHDISIRSFASLVGMSPQQISNIIKGTGNNGKPMSSTMSTYKKIAEALGFDEQAFLLVLNDSVRVNPQDERDELKTLIDSFSDQEVSEILEFVKNKARQK